LKNNKKAAAELIYQIICAVDRSYLKENEQKEIEQVLSQLSLK